MRNKRKEIQHHWPLDSGINNPFLLIYYLQPRSSLCFCMWKICKRIFNLYLHGHHLFADRHLSDVWVLRFAQFSENIIRFFIIITINLFYITFFSRDNEPSKYWLQNKFRKNKSSLPHQKRQLFHFYHTQSANCPNTSPLLIYIVSFKPSFTLPTLWNLIQSLLYMMDTHHFEER